MIREEIDFRPKVADSIKIDLSDRMPKDEDMLRDPQTADELLHGNWEKDDKLLAENDKIAGLFVAIFEKSSNHKQASRTVSRHTLVDNRSMSWYMTSKWIDGQDYRVVQEVKATSDLIHNARTTYLLHVNRLELVERDRLKQGIFELPGSLLTSPPLSGDPKFLDRLIDRSHVLRKKLKKIIARLGTKEGQAIFRKSTDPNIAVMGFDKKDKTPIPVTQGRFSPISI